MTAGRVSGSAATGDKRICTPCDSLSTPCDSRTTPSDSRKHRHGVRGTPSGSHGHGGLPGRWRLTPMRRVPFRPGFTSHPAARPLTPAPPGNLPGRAGRRGASRHALGLPPPSLPAPSPADSRATLADSPPGPRRPGTRLNAVEASKSPSDSRAMSPGALVGARRRAVRRRLGVAAHTGEEEMGSRSRPALALWLPVWTAASVRLRPVARGCGVGGPGFSPDCPVQPRDGAFRAALTPSGSRLLRIQERFKGD